MSDPPRDDGDGSTPTTHYSLLGVPRDASEEEIVAAYREQALEHHPDVAERPGSEQYMRYLNRARETLLDPQKRAAYDAKLAEMGIEPESGDPSGQTESASRARRKTIEYVTDREPPVDLVYPRAPFGNRVANVALRSWVRRVALIVLVAVLAAQSSVGLGPVGPVDPPLSTVAVAIGVVSVLDAVYVARSYPDRLHDDPAVEPRSVLRAVRTAGVGAVLWSGAVSLGGTPHAFAGHVVVPLVVGAVPVAVLCRYVSLPRRLSVLLSGAAGATLAVPLLGSAPAFVPPTQFPTTQLVGTILGGGIGLVSLVAVGTGIVFGAPAISRLAWEYRYRSAVRPAPAVWEGLVALPVTLAALALSAGTAGPSIVDTYARAVVAAGVTPRLAGLVLAWTVPAVGVALVARLRFGSVLASVRER